MENSEKNETAATASGTQKTDGNASKSNAIKVPQIELPKGGGAIRNIDEKFSVNPSNGSSSFSIPLPFSPGRNGFTPSLAVSYNSGTGNGLLGIGWSLETTMIQVKTDKQLPVYNADDDVYLFSGAEDLVPFLSWNGAQWIAAETSIGSYYIQRFRPRTESTFARIEKITHPVHGVFWRTCSAENVTTFYGHSSAARVYDPVDETRIFQWLPEFSFDDRGNCIVYEYKAEDTANVSSSLHEAHRLSGMAAFTNKYLKRIFHGNRTPVYVNPADPFVVPAGAGAFVFETVFDFGEHDADFPLPAETPAKQWSARSDAFSSYRSGFEIRTYRLLHRVLFYHRFDELHNGTATLVRSVDFDFGKTSDDSQQPTELSCLLSITQCGYVLKPDNTYSKKTIPPVEFTYEKLNWSSTVLEPAADGSENIPAGLSGNYQWLDLFGEGISGIFTEQGDGWYYKANNGDVPETGIVSFAGLKPVSPKPSFTGMGSGALQLQDIAGDGNKQIVYNSAQVSGYFELTAENNWDLFRVFENRLNVDLHDPNVRMLDLNGDGIADVLVTENEVLTFYYSEGKSGYGPAHRQAKAADEEKGPAVVFADLQQSIFLADMSGDGLTDLVRIRNGEVCYWPNLGFGKFGVKVNMNNAPVFDHPDAFNPAFLQLADVSGTGLTDLLYIGQQQCTAYLNLAGNSWSSGHTITDAFRTARPDTIAVADITGNGTSCLVWSSQLPGSSGHTLRYIDLMSGKKPHLLTRHINNLGMETEVEYKSSTWFYLKDKAAGRPWITKLPFPVHCVRKKTVTDKITGTKFTSSFCFHHGYYDHAEREFRGFGMVEQVDTEDYEHWVKSGATNIVPADMHQPPVLTKTWFHTGAFLEKEKILNQYAREYWYEELKTLGLNISPDEAALPDAKLVAAANLDPSIIAGLSHTEWREAFRACKGMTLRQEIFALDAPATGATTDELKKQGSPFSVATHNCHIELLQPRHGNRFAVFIVKESEAVTYHYERNTSDPRIAHTLNIRFDELGNVLESASVVYPRKINDPSLPADIQLKQQTGYITCSEVKLTNDVITPHEYCLRKGAETKSWELKGIAKITPLYTPADFADILNTSQLIAYQELDFVPPPGTTSRRLLEHTRSLFYKNDLAGPLPLYTIEVPAISYESYQLAYTPDMLTNIFGGRVNDTMMQDEAKFLLLQGNWWIRSGTVQYLDNGETGTDARNHFYAPVSYTEPFGGKTLVRYISNYYLFIKETEDALQNTNTIVTFNFRTLSPQKVKDPNDNLTEVLKDELGLAKVSAVYGKGNEADDLTGHTEYTTPAEEAALTAFLTAATSDQLVVHGKALLQHATARFVYDVFRYKNTAGKSPAVTAGILREQHYAQNNDSPIQIGFEYSNGGGGVVMKKVQCEPGMAKQVTVNPDNSITVSETDTSLLVPKQLRWLGNGRTVLNNKGKPVKQYEPYFSVTHEYEDYKELVETGVTPVLYYDAAGRQVRTDYPNGTFTHVEYDSWKQSSYDQNDNVLQSEWYNRRINNLMDAELLAEGKDPVKEKEAAQQTALHADTPVVQHFDTLGRPVLILEHNGFDNAAKPILHFTRHETDIEGNVICIIDPRGNNVMQYLYDMQGHPVYQHSMDSGKRLMFKNVLGNPLRTWDERNHEFQYEYDTNHRLTGRRVLGGDGPEPLNHLVEKTVYGETIPGAVLKNFRGRPVIVYDTAGKVETLGYDFNGNILETKRTFTADYKTTANWDTADPDSLLENASYTISSSFDALNRVLSQTGADGSVFTPGYNESGALSGVQLTQGAINEIIVKNIVYNEKRYRSKIWYGNDIVTTYSYDSETFAMLRLESKKQNNEQLQDYKYTFDATGNITHAEDKCIPAVYFDNQKITGTATYSYDPLYRLIQATGREHVAQTSFAPDDNWNDIPFIKQYNAGDTLAWRGYTEQYEYDDAGNLSQMKHIVQGAGGWTRNYTNGQSNNRIISSKVGQQDYSYPHHATHGFIKAMPHLQVMEWNFAEQLQAISRQKVNNGKAETTYYVYDGQGKRVRKITEWEDLLNTGNPPKKSDRIYLHTTEFYTMYDNTGTPQVKRTSTHILEADERIALVEQKVMGPAGEPDRLVRYQLPNYLDTATIETDTAGKIISYEEFHPFGTTAYHAVDKNINAAFKRYRFTGMERDEESGLAYHNARYYVPWLGRWLSCDPAGLSDGLNLYAYVKNNPVLYHDKNGKQKVSAKAANFENDWIENIAIPLLTVDEFEGKQISFDKRMLMLQHARGESLGQAKDSAGEFKPVLGNNIYNFQSAQTNQPTVMVNRPDYGTNTGKKKSDNAFDMSAKVFSKAYNRNVDKYKVGSDGVSIYEWNDKTMVPVPLYDSVQDGTKAYLRHLKANKSAALDALTDSSKTETDFFKGLIGYGSLGYKTVAEVEKHFKFDLKKSLLDYAQKTLPGLQASLKSDRDYVRQLRDYYAEVKHYLIEGSADGSLTADEKIQWNAILEDTRKDIKETNILIAKQAREEKVLKEIIARFGSTP